MSSTSDTWKIPGLAVLLALALAAIPQVSGTQALFAGLGLTTLLRYPLPVGFKPWNSRLLGLSIVLMGAGTPLVDVFNHGTKGLWISALLILMILLAGSVLGRLLEIDAPIRTLISSGTAICGGSAIAATGPAIGAGSEQMGVAIAVVFLLNAISVLTFPPLGHALQLTPEEFGRFAALAIHDTSSVLAASVAFGGGAELTAVPMKLARALWIVPMAATLGYINSKNRSHHQGKAPLIPWFIPAFVITAAAFTFLAPLAAHGASVAFVGKRLLVGTLFLIGNSISAQALKRAGIRPLLLGILLWSFAIGASYVLLKFIPGN